MHQYSTDTKRWKIFVVIGAAALLITVPLNELLRSIFPGVISTFGGLTVIAVATAIYGLYRYFLWVPVGRLLESQTPNIDGEWKLTMDTANALKEQPSSDVRLHIAQDWTHMQIDCVSEAALAVKSDSAKISTQDGTHPELIATMIGTVPDGSEYTRVEGTFRLRLFRTDDTEELRGRYYSTATDAYPSRVAFELDTNRLIRRKPLAA